MRKNFSYLLLLSALLIGSTISLSAQAVEFNELDKSPMDAAHYPSASAYQNYLGEDDPRRKQQIKVLYSRPQKKGRVLFGDLVPYGEDYRLGANEATEVTFFQSVEIGNTVVPRGTYTIFATPYPNEWIIKISAERFIAGTSNRDITKDVVAVAVPVQTVGTEREYFTIGFQKVNDGMVNMIFAWDRTQVELPINLNPPALNGEDVSPMDLVQYPNRSRFRNFLKEEELDANEPKVRVVYARPQMKGRTIFGDLVGYDKKWRLGANETTEVTFFTKATVGGKEIKPGRYGIFAQVNKDSWDITLHKNVQSWGLANHDDADNIVTVNVATEKTPETLEALSMTFVEKTGNQVELVIGWENTMVRLPITLK